MAVYRGHAFVDWDDTVAACEPLFNAMEDRLSRLVGERLGLDPAAVYSRGRQFDLLVAAEMGLVRASFPTAWVRCYTALCREQGRAPDPRLRDEIWALADTIYDMEQPLLPDAPGVLAWLHREGFEVTVWTAGEPAVQESKIEASGLAHLVHRRVVVPQKTPAALRQALDGRMRQRTFVVGNSLRADILPALSLDLLAVHVPAVTFDDNGLEPPPDHSRYRRLPYLRGLPDLLGREGWPVAGMGPMDGAGPISGAGPVAGAG